MGDPRLVVDYGGFAARAGVVAAGRLTSVLFDGSSRLPSGVYIASTGEVITGQHAVSRGLDCPSAYVSDPIRHLGQPSITVGSLAVDPVDLVSAVLRHVGSVAAMQAGISPDALTVAVPAGWGPRRRAAMCRAATVAGLPAPTLVTAPVAALARIGCSVAVGGAVLVCDVGATFSATVLASTSDGWQVLSTVDAADGAGAAADEALMRYVCQRIATVDTAIAEQLAQPVGDVQLRDRMTVLANVRAAKEAAVGGPVLIATPLPQLSVTLDPARLSELTAEVRTHAVAAVTAAVEAADLEAGQLAAVYSVGASSPLPGFAEACTTAAAAPPLPVERPDVAALVGAASITPPSEPAGKARSGWSALGLVSTVLAMVLGPILVYRALTALPDERLNEYGMTVYFNYGMYGLGCGLAGTAALGVALFAVTALRAPTISGLLGLPASLPTRRLPGLILAGSAVFALVLVWMYQLVATAFLDPDPPELTRWTVLPILPTCLAGVFLGAAVVVGAEGVALDRLRRVAFPVLPLACAAIGALAYEQTRHIPLQYKMHWMLYLALRCSAALIAVGAVVLLLAGLRPLVIAMVAVPVAVLTAAVVDVDGLGPVAASYLGAAAWWWLSRAASTSFAILRGLISRAGSTGLLSSGASAAQPRSPAAFDDQGVAYPQQADRR